MFLALEFGQSVKCEHTSKQSDNLFLLDSSLRERELKFNGIILKRSFSVVILIDAYTQKVFYAYQGGKKHDYTSTA